MSTSSRDPPRSGDLKRYLMMAVITLGFRITCRRATRRRSRITQLGWRSPPMEPLKIIR